jgi:radical SAM superfamily enzyme YgiQ (UPF0313 family)
VESLRFVFLYQPHPYDVNPDAQLGLGLLLLASYARDLGASVRVINAQSASVKEAIKMIPECDYLMMYGCLIDKPIIEEIAKAVKCKVCVGGPITFTYVDNVDYVCQGFGEDFVASLILPTEKWHPLKLNHNINYYPTPDRTLIEGSLGGNIFRYKGAKPELSTTLLTSRGCRFKCAFCTSGSDKFFSEYYIDRIEDEFKRCLMIGIKNFRISDDNLIASKQRLTQLCELFNKADIRWRGSIRVHPSTLKLYKMMKASGCEELSFGIESGDESVLKLLNKGTTRKKNTKAIRNAKKAGIFTCALMMMGTPGETPDTLGRNIGWVKEAQPDMVSLKMFVPYPGTAIYHNPEKYKCKIHLPLQEVNNSAYRPDGSEPVANIDSEKMYAEELTRQFLEMRSWLESEGLENRG